jgi:hypothetical protein
LRTARTRSFSWGLGGGAQSSAPAIVADGGDAVPPDLSELARAPSHRVWLQVPQRFPWSASSCGPRLHGASQAIIAGARSFVPEFSCEPRERARPRSCRIPHPRGPYWPPEPPMGHRCLLGRREGRWRVRVRPISRHAAGRNCVRLRGQPGRGRARSLDEHNDCTRVGGRVRRDKPWRRLRVRAFPHEPLSGVTSPRLHGRVPAMRRIIISRTCPFCRRITGCIVEPFSSPSYSARRPGIRHAHE